MLTRFQDNSQFTRAQGIHRNPVIDHLVEVNPVDYVIASIIGARLTDRDITLSFAKMVNDKLKLKNSQEIAKNLMGELHKYDPIKDIFNAVPLSCNPTVPINHFGYAAPKSPNKANKIC